ARVLNNILRVSAISGQDQDEPKQLARMLAQESHEFGLRVLRHNGHLAEWLDSGASLAPPQPIPVRLQRRLIRSTKQRQVATRNAQLPAQRDACNAAIA